MASKSKADDSEGKKGREMRRKGEQLPLYPRTDETPSTPSEFNALTEKPSNTINHPAS